MHARARARATSSLLQEKEESILAERAVSPAQLCRLGTAVPARTLDLKLLFSPAVPCLVVLETIAFGESLFDFDIDTVHCT